jgi:hypothetical protein
VFDNQATIQKIYGAKEVGAHPITATYLGDGNNISSTAAPFIQYVGTFPVATKVVLSASPSPSRVGQPVTITAIVSSAYPKYGAIPDGELVWFYDGTRVLGSVPLLGGTAQFTTSSLPAKIHTIKATYVGDAIFKPKTATVQLIVSK